MKGQQDPTKGEIGKRIRDNDIYAYNSLLNQMMWRRLLMQVSGRIQSLTNTASGSDFSYWEIFHGRRRI